MKVREKTSGGTIGGGITAKGQVPYKCRMKRRASYEEHRIIQAIEIQAWSRKGQARAFKLNRLRQMAIISGDWSSYEDYLKA